MASWSSGYVIGNWIRVSKFESWKFRKYIYIFFFEFYFWKVPKTIMVSIQSPKISKAAKRPKKSYFNDDLNVIPMCWHIFNDEKSDFEVYAWYFSWRFLLLVSDSKAWDSREHCLVGIHYCGLDWMRKLGMKHKTESNVCNHSKYDS